MKTKLLKLSTVLLTATLLITLLPLILVQAASSTILINAIYYDTYLSGEPEESFQLINVSTNPVDLINWTVTDFEGVITLTGVLNPNQTLWIAREADDFYLEFGFEPDYEYQSNTDPAVPDLVRSGSLILADGGDQLAVRNASSTLVDAVVYEGVTRLVPIGWVSQSSPMTRVFSASRVKSSIVN